MNAGHDTGVLIDATSLTSAEDYLLSQNRHKRPADPFARQCFVEVVQSLIFLSAVHVAHPVLPDPRPDDFGRRPQLQERLGLRRAELSPVGRELAASVASVTQTAPGVPKVAGLWVGARTLGKQRAFTGAQPYQRFLYREFVDAWKRSGR